MNGITNMYAVRQAYAMKYGVNKSRTLAKIAQESFKNKNMGHQ